VDAGFEANVLIFQEVRCDLLLHGIIIQTLPVLVHNPRPHPRDLLVQDQRILLSVVLLGNCKLEVVPFPGSKGPLLRNAYTSPSSHHILVLSLIVDEEARTYVLVGRLDPWVRAYLPLLQILVHLHHRSVPFILLIHHLLGISYPDVLILVVLELLGTLGPEAYRILVLLLLMLLAPIHQWSHTHPRNLKVVVHLDFVKGFLAVGA